MSAAEKIEQIVTHPIVSKIAPAIPIGSGGAYALEYTQGVLAITSMIVGIAAGILVAIYNYKRNKLIDRQIEREELEMKKLRNSGDDNG